MRLLLPQDRGKGKIRQPTGRRCPPSVRPEGNHPHEELATAGVQRHDAFCIRTKCVGSLPCSVMAGDFVYGRSTTFAPAERLTLSMLPAGTVMSPGSPSLT